MPKTLFLFTFLSFPFHFVTLHPMIFFFSFKNSSLLMLNTSYLVEFFMLTTRCIITMYKLSFQNQSNFNLLLLNYLIYNYYCFILSECKLNALALSLITQRAIIFGKCVHQIRSSLQGPRGSLHLAIYRVK